MRHLSVFFTICLPIYLTTLTSANASTNQFFVICDTCNHNSDFEAIAANKYANSGHQIAKIIVVNFESRTHKKYRVRTVFEPGTSPDLQIDNSSFTSSQRTKVNSLQSQYDAHFSKFSTKSQALQVDIPESIAPSAYDIVGKSATENRVKQYVADNPGLVNTVFVSMWEYGSILGKWTSVPYIIDVQFTDGSSLQLQYKISLNGALTPVTISVVDADGNNVYLTVAEYNSNLGEFEFSDADNASAFSSAMGRLGASFGSGFGGATGGSGETKLICTTTETPSGLEVNCVRQ